ncbi:SAM-dependent methyltransferase [Nocardia nova]|uniref:SAM-dependent methyltransferase n=1 Tax=Nocardia nova TaxID=37330 RepID=UPI0033F4EBAE
MREADERLARCLAYAQPARVRQFLLGGKEVFESDRALCAALIEAHPHARYAAAVARAFHRWATDALAGVGVGQFLDIGAGYEPCVHRIAQARNPAARTVYADMDPIVLAHGRAQDSDEKTRWIDVDLTDPDAVLTLASEDGLLDLSEPVALSLVGVLEHIGGDELAAGAIRELTAGLTSGSALIVTHAAADIDPVRMEQAAIAYSEHGLTYRPRAYDRIAEYFTDFELESPGIVGPHQWMRSPHAGLERITDEDICCYAAIGWKK